MAGHQSPAAESWMAGHGTATRRTCRRDDGICLISRRRQRQFSCRTVEKAIRAPLAVECLASDVSQLADRLAGSLKEVCNSDGRQVKHSLSPSYLAGTRGGEALMAANVVRNGAARPGGQSMTPAQLQAHLELRRGSRSSRHVRADRKGTRAARIAADTRG